MRIPFTNIELRAERRPRPGPWEDEWYQAPSLETSTGIDVNADNALKYSAIWACIKVISEDISSLPLFVYSRNGKSKERATEHPLYPLLHDAPNKEMSAMQFREAMQAHLLSWGNAYAQIQRDNRRRILALWPLNPARMKVTRDTDNELVYEYRPTDSNELILFPKDEILHIAGMSPNGLMGYSPIAYHREAIGVGLAAQDMQGNSYRNGARMSVVFVHPAPKAPAQEGRDAFRKDLQRQYGGTSNAGKVAVLWEGMEPKPISMSMKDAEFIESRKFTRTEICAIYRIPPHKIMDLERSTFSNIEHQGLEYVTDTLRPWLIRWEQAINQRLLDGSREYQAEHLVEGLMRGDIQSRYAAYATGRQWGWLSINDIRSLENMNPIADGDDYLQPMNMVPVGEDEKMESEPITDEEIERAARTLRRLRLIKGA